MLPQAVAINLLSTAIWELTLAPLFRGKRLLPRPPSPKSRTRLAKAISDAAKELSRAARVAGVPSSIWEGFLGTPAVHALVRDIFTFRMDDCEPTLEEIRVAFRAQWAMYLEEEGLQNPYDIDAFFDLLVANCNSMLDCAIADEVVASHEARSAARHKVVVGRLDALAGSLRQRPATSAVDLASFAARLRSAVRQRYSTIEPPSLTGRRRVPLDDLYVTPAFGAGRKSPTADLSSLLVTLSRVIVLGNPGAGKSTLGAKLCSVLTEDGVDGKVMGRSVVPWPIELRKYAANNENLATSIIAYFEQWARGSYSLEVPRDAFTTLLETGGLLVVFDGLDELLDTSLRVEVRDAVESFCIRFPLTPVLITSRIVGYTEAPLDRALFDQWELLSFDEPRVNEYARKWFHFQLADEPVEDRVERTQNFLAESEMAKDLRTNPLLLSLLCSSYRGAGYIPNNLPDIYDSCATLLFSTWDKQRHIAVLLPFAEHVRPALRELAWWVFTNEDLSVGITRRQAIEKTADYLHRRRFSDKDKARAAAEEFIDFCRGRAWVFTDQGATATGELLYGFTHRTFLEFFSAEHLAYRNETAAKLVARLAPEIAHQSWDVVAQIALQIKARSYPDGADDVVRALYDELRAREGVALVSSVDFLLRLMRAVVPSPVVSQGLGTNLIKIPIGQWRSGKQRDTARALLRTMAEVGPEIREEVGRGVTVVERDLLMSNEPRLRALGSELLLRGIAAPRDEGGFTHPLWREAYAAFMAAHRDLLLTVIMEDATVAADWYLMSDLQAELVAKHGVRIVLTQRMLEMAGRLRASPIVRLSRSSKGKRTAQRSRQMMSDVGSAYRNGPETALPPAKLWKADPAILATVATFTPTSWTELTDSEMWGLWFASCGTFEWLFSAERTKQAVSKWANVLEEALLPEVNMLGRLCRRRLEGRGVDVNEIVQDAELGSELATAMRRWGNGRLRLVAAR